MTIKVSTNKLVNLGFRGRMQVLELVHCLELDDVETVGHDPVRLAFQEMLRLVRRDVGDGREDVRAVCRRTLNAVAVVYATLASFMIDVKVL